ncbi:sugar phosphate isomerase/epimerase family protein [Thalassotalea profundi]|uniref:Sugar phosphate isomerase n=1 Tax=Thalassotalea profundi TaxID=2036687 RepID=A0ABQ3ITB6_9GAMM|nr:sugar phosphate isomerase/epimerase [Thalassotalea profundi]GHE91304.1 sugar phosphate isomerase [Thalassotalea profundi]
MTLKSPQISLQTFTIRHHMKTPQKVEASYARLKNMGINAVELAYMKLTQPYINAVKKSCEQLEMKVATSQIKFDILQKDFDWVIDFHQQLNCNITSVSVLPLSVILGNKQNWLDFAKSLNELGARYQEKGINLLFHHHDFEFAHFVAEDGTSESGLNLLMNQTDSDNVGLVIDTYWAQKGGCSPSELIKQMKGRVQAIHLRDYNLKPRLLTMKPYDCELGKGNLNIQNIIEACKHSEVKYMAIEHASKKPFESIELSSTYLKDMGYQHLF